MQTHVLYNIAIAWIEEVLYRQRCFVDVPVIRAYGDGVEPQGMFVTVDLTEHGPSEENGQPLSCEIEGEDGFITTRTYEEWLVRFSISVYRDRHLKTGEVASGFDAANSLAQSIKNRNMQRDAFSPHGLVYDRVGTVTPLREIIKEKWEQRHQFSVSFKYKRCDIETECIMEICVGDADCEKEKQVEDVDPEEDCDVAA